MRGRKEGEGRRGGKGRGRKEGGGGEEEGEGRRGREGGGGEEGEGRRGREGGGGKEGEGRRRRKEGRGGRRESALDGRSVQGTATKLTKQQTLFLLHCKGHLSAAVQLQEKKRKIQCNS